MSQVMGKMTLKKRQTFLNRTGKIRHSIRKQNFKRFKNLTTKHKKDFLEFLNLDYMNFTILYDGKCYDFYSPISKEEYDIVKALKFELIDKISKHLNELYTLNDSSFDDLDDCRLDSRPMPLETMMQVALKWEPIQNFQSKITSEEYLVAKLKPKDGALISRPLNMENQAVASQFFDCYNNDAFIDMWFNTPKEAILDLEHQIGLRMGESDETKRNNLMGKNKGEIINEETI